MAIDFSNPVAVSDVATDSPSVGPVATAASSIDITRPVGNASDHILDRINRSTPEQLASDSELRNFVGSTPNQAGMPGFYNSFKNRLSPEQVDKLAQAYKLYAESPVRVEDIKKAVPGVLPALWHMAKGAGKLAWDQASGLVAVPTGMRSVEEQNKRAQEDLAAIETGSSTGARALKNVFGNWGDALLTSSGQPHYVRGLGVVQPKPQIEDPNATRNDFFGSAAWQEQLDAMNEGRGEVRQNLPDVVSVLQGLAAQNPSNPLSQAILSMAPGGKVADVPVDINPNRVREVSAGADLTLALPLGVGGRAAKTAEEAAKLGERGLLAGAAKATLEKAGGKLTKAGDAIDAGLKRIRSQVGSPIAVGAGVSAAAAGVGGLVGGADKAASIGKTTIAALIAARLSPWLLRSAGNTITRAGTSGLVPDTVEAGVKGFQHGVPVGVAMSYGGETPEERAALLAGGPIMGLEGALAGRGLHVGKNLTESQLYKLSELAHEKSFALAPALDPTENFVLPDVKNENPQARETGKGALPKAAEGAKPGASSGMSALGAEGHGTLTGIEAQHQENLNKLRSIDSRLGEWYNRWRALMFKTEGKRSYILTPEQAESVQRGLGKQEGVADITMPDGEKATITVMGEKGQVRAANHEYGHLIWRYFLDDPTRQVFREQNAPMFEAFKQRYMSKPGVADAIKINPEVGTDEYINEEMGADLFGAGLGQSGKQLATSGVGRKVMQPLSRLMEALGYYNMLGPEDNAPHRTSMGINRTIPETRRSEAFAQSLLEDPRAQDIISGRADHSEAIGPELPPEGSIARETLGNNGGESPPPAGADGVAVLRPTPPPKPVGADQVVQIGRPLPRADMRGSVAIPADATAQAAEGNKVDAARIKAAQPAPAPPVEPQLPADAEKQAASGNAVDAARIKAAETRRSPTGEAEITAAIPAKPTAPIESTPPKAAEPANLRGVPADRYTPTPGADIDSQKGSRKFAETEQAVSDSWKIGGKVQSVVETIFNNLRKPVKLRYFSAPTADEATFGRTQRRAEIEAARGLPPGERQLTTKVGVPVSMKTVNEGTDVQVQMFSPDKAIMNANRLAADDLGRTAIPMRFEVEGGRLTPDAEKQVDQLLADYTGNQDHGYKGDGTPLIRPKGEYPSNGFIPARDPNYKPVRLSEEDANFANLLVNSKVPSSTRVNTQKNPVTGEKEPITPVQVRAADIAKANNRVGAPVLSKKGEAQTYAAANRPDVVLSDYNPLREQLRQKGATVINQLEEAYERPDASYIDTVEPHTGNPMSASVGDTTAAGFSPGGKPAEGFVRPGETQPRDESRGPAFSVASFEQGKWQEEFRTAARRRGYTQQDVDSAISMVRGVVDLYKARPDIFPQEGARKSNGDLLPTILDNADFGKTFDVNRICKRVMQYHATLGDVQRRVGRPLNEDELLALGQEMRKAGDIPFCIFCYVEASRRAANRNAYNFAVKTPEQVLEESQVGGKKLGALYEGLKRRDELLKQAGMTAEEFAATVVDRDKTRALEAQGGAKAELVKLFNSYVTGAKGTAMTTNGTYDREILRMPKSDIDDANERAGMRWLSATDLDPTQLADTLPGMWDSTVRGLAGHEYTKEPYSALIFGLTGMKINLSIGMNGRKAGGFTDDVVNGMPLGVAMRLREKFPNVGTMFVAKNREQLDWALAHPGIDMIIPHHAANWSGRKFVHFDLDDFTSVQREKWVDRSKAPRVTETDSEGNVTARVQSPKEVYGNKLWYTYWLKRTGGNEIAAAKAYVDFCRAHNLYPKFGVKSRQFRDYSSDPGYYKLLKDYARTDSPQTPLDASKIDTKRLTEFIQRFTDQGGWEAREKPNPETVAKFSEFLKSGEKLDLAEREKSIDTSPTRYKIDSPESLRISSWKKSTLPTETPEVERYGARKTASGNIERYTPAEVRASAVKPKSKAAFSPGREEVSDPESVGRSLGLSYNPAEQSGGVSLKGLPPALAAQMPRHWEFTDRRPESPTRGATFYVPAGSSPEVVRNAWRAKQVEMGSDKPAFAPGTDHDTEGSDASLTRPEDVNEVAQRLYNQNADAEGKHFIIVQDSGDIHIFQNAIAAEKFKISEAEKNGGTLELDERVGRPGESIQDVLDSAKKVVGKGNKNFHPERHRERPSGNLVEIDQPAKNKVSATHVRRKDDTRRN